MKDKISLGIIVFVSFVLGGLAMYYFNSNNQYVTNTGNSQLNNNYNNSCVSCADTIIVENGSLSAAIQKVNSSAVMVKNYKNNKLSGTGSGFVYKVDEKYTYIMTNHHVVDGGNKWTIINSDDVEIEGTVLGSDEYLDLAVIRIEKTDNMPAVAIGNVDEISLGDQVFTVGSPVGYEYRGTITNGIISGKDRLVEVSISGNGDDWVMEVIQTNAAVNPGNSGGPLVNAEGEVIGVISLKLVEDSIEGMGFAIPIDYAMSHIDVLESGKKIERPLLGISMINASGASAWTLLRQYGITLDSDIDSGVIVIEVAANSGASKSDLKKGDVITKIDGKEVTNSAYLKYLLYKYEVGDTVELTYYRDGRFKTTKITLTKSEG